MELTPTDIGFNKNTSGDHNEKDRGLKKTGKTTDRLRFPFEAPEKPKDKRLQEPLFLFKRQQGEVSLLTNEPALDRKAANDSIEEAVLSKRIPDEESRPPKTEPFPSPEEAWQRLQVDYRAVETDTIARLNFAEAELSLQEGADLDLPLEAREIHTRLSFETPYDARLPVATENPSESHQAPPMPETPEDLSANEPESVEAPPAPMESGGGNFEPPEPPLGPENFSDMPDPDPQPPLIREPVLTSWRDRTERQHQMRLAEAVPITNAAEQIHPRETIIERHGGGEALALLVGVTDWWRGRRIRRELRRGQKRQDRQIRQLTKSERQSRERYNLQIQQQQTVNERLKRQVDNLTEVSRREQANERRVISLERALKQEQLRRTKPYESRRDVVRPLIRPDISRAVIGEVLQLPPDHHLEKSTWHSIEVDRSGRAVERPVFNYGREFKREQQQELHTDDAKFKALSTGHIALNGSDRPAMRRPVYSVGLPGVYIPASMLDAPVGRRPAYSQIASGVRQPRVLVAVVVILFIIVSLVILR